MNKKEMAEKVSERSGVSLEESKKVIDAFEKVLEEELGNAGGLGGAFDKLYSVMHFFKGKKEKKTL